MPPCWRVSCEATSAAKAACAVGAACEAGVAKAACTPGAACAEKPSAIPRRIAIIATTKREQRLFPTVSPELMSSLSHWWHWHYCTAYQSSKIARENEKGPFIFERVRLPDFKIVKVDTEGFRFLAKLVCAHTLEAGGIEDRRRESARQCSLEIVSHVVAKPGFYSSLSSAMRSMKYSLNPGKQKFKIPFDRS